MPPKSQPDAPAGSGTRVLRSGNTYTSTSPDLVMNSGVDAASTVRVPERRRTGQHTNTLGRYEPHNSVSSRSVQRVSQADVPRASAAPDDVAQRAPDQVQLDGSSSGLGIEQMSDPRTEDNVGSPQQGLPNSQRSKSPSPSYTSDTSNSLSSHASTASSNAGHVDTSGSQQRPSESQATSYASTVSTVHDLVESPILPPSPSNFWTYLRRNLSRRLTRSEYDTSRRTYLLTSWIIAINILPVLVLNPSGSESLADDWNSSSQFIRAMVIWQMTLIASCILIDQLAACAFGIAEAFALDDRGTLRQTRFTSLRDKEAILKPACFIMCAFTLSAARSRYRPADTEPSPVDLANISIYLWLFDVVLEASDEFLRDQNYNIPVASYAILVAVVANIGLWLTAPSVLRAASPGEYALAHSWAQRSVGTNLGGKSAPTATSSSLINYFTDNVVITRNAEDRTFAVTYSAIQMRELLSSTPTKSSIQSPQ